MNLGKSEKRILLMLFSSADGLLAFTVYKKLNVTPSEFYLALQSLHAAELIDQTDERISLTPKAEAIIATKNLHSPKLSAEWDSVPEVFKGPRIAIDDFYIPRADLFA